MHRLSNRTLAILWLVVVLVLVALACGGDAATPPGRVHLSTEHP